MQYRGCGCDIARIHSSKGCGHDIIHGCGLDTLQ